MRVNQNGDHVEETYINTPNCFLSAFEVKAAVILLAERQGLCLVRTNATEHGYMEIELREENQ